MSGGGGSSANVRATDRRPSSWWSRDLVVVTCWLAVLVASVLVLTAAHDPLWHVVRYLAVWAVLVSLPGVLVYRRLAGTTTAVEEVGFGSVLGIPLFLASWAVATAVHLTWLTAAIPAAVLVVFVAHPGLRPLWSPERDQSARTPVRWHLAAAAVSVLALVRTYWTDFRLIPLPPRTSNVLQDFWYNSGIGYELERTLRAQDPSVVGERLHYHWFANAHAVAMAQISDVPVYESIMHLWFVPILITLILAVCAVAQRLMAGDGSLGLERWWVGPVAGVLVTVLPLILDLRPPGVTKQTDGFVTSSPSGVLAAILLLAICGPVLDILHGRARRGTWAVLVMLLGVSAGTKPSILPVVICGALLVAVRQRWTGSRDWRSSVLIAGIAIGLTALAVPFVTGSTGGSRIQPFGLVVSDPSYQRLFGDGAIQRPAGGGFVLPALADHRPGALLVVTMVVLAYVGTESVRLLGILGPASKVLRADLATWWGAGVLLGGFAGMWILAHPGQSEHWFWTTTIPLATVLVVTNATRVDPPSARARQIAGFLVVTAVAGVVLARILSHEGRVGLDQSRAVVLWQRLGPYLGVLLLLAVFLVVAYVLRRRGGSAHVPPLLTVATVFLVAATLPGTWTAFDARTGPVVAGRPKGLPVNYRSLVTEDQQRAAMWLNRHSAPTDVVATNVVCRPVAYRPGCNNVALWVAGLTGRRLVLGGWGYTSKSLDRFDGTTKMSYLPNPWPQRLRLSLDVVRAPTAAVVDELHDRYDARWVFADRGATTISPDLSRYATLRYANKAVEVWQLDKGLG